MPITKRYALTASTIKTLGPGLHADGGGLYLYVNPQDGTRSWLFIWRQDGKQQRRGLGGTATRTLAEARRLAERLRQAVAQGRHPDEILRPNTREITFASATREFVALKRPGWRSAKHARQWEKSLEDYAFPVIGDRPPSAIRLDDILAILAPIWQKKPETANRVRQRIEAVLDYCAVRGWREEDNPARWRGKLDKILASPSRLKGPPRHFSAIPYQEAKALWAWLKPQTSPAACCLRFIMLTACRSGEARGARWSEIDLDARIWQIPADRMKARRTHRIPLSDAAIAVLKEAASMRCPRAPDLVFSSPRCRILADAALSSLLREYGDYTVHGLRATFKTWASETTPVPARVVEAALAHVNRDRTEAAYERSDYLEQRRPLMEMWAQYLLDKKKRKSRPRGS